MMQQLIAIISKNLIILSRNKASSAVIILGPLLFLFVVGTGLNTTGLTGIMIGIYPGDNQDLVSGIEEQMRQRDIELIEFPEIEDCREAVYAERIHSCIVLPNASSKDNRITFYVDYTKINLVPYLVSIMSEGVSAETREISLNLTAELINRIDESSRILQEKSGYLNESELELQKITEIISAIKTDLDELNNNVDLNFAIATLEQNDLQSAVSYTDDIETSLGQSRNTLAGIRQSASNLINALNARQTEIDNALTTITSVQISLGCTGTEGSLADTLDNATAMVETLLNSPNPNCLHLNTYQQILATEKASVQNSLSETNNLIQKLDGFSFQLDSFSSGNAQFGSNLKKSLNDINTITASLRNYNAQALQFIDKAKTNVGIIDISINTEKQSFGEISSGIRSIEERLGKVEISDAEKIVSPFNSRTEAIVAQKKRFEYLFPYMVILVTMFVGLLTNSYMSLKERKSSAFFRNSITPVTDWVFLLAILLTSFIIVLIQVLLFFLLGKFYFGIELGANAEVLIPTVIISILVFAMIGIIIGNIIMSAEITIISAVFIAMLMFIFSSLLVPIEGLRQAMSILVKINPFYIAVTLLKKIILFNQGWNYVNSLFLLLLLETLIFAAIAFITFRASIIANRGDKN